ncbi:uncharacterized protein LOC130371509 isoform X1 [Gadus chalcogrammus]|uniref:uncharacterized protein LOC130371509 isoform X1 n=2 Tax=Gadus chalcogrammus TaxID=1042646 RepID=UPI0024C4C514|nr:uncharacterized protein LOC130371509 isoform X1 [Gadus chalcogrammus]
MALVSLLRVFWICLFLFSSGTSAPLTIIGSSSREDELNQDSSSLDYLEEPRAPGASSRKSGSLDQALSLWASGMYKQGSIPSYYLTLQDPDKPLEYFTKPQELSMTGLVDQRASSGGPSEDVPENEGHLIEPRALKTSPAKASPSVSMSKEGSILPLNPLQQGSGGAGAPNQEAPQGKGVSAVVAGAHQLSSGTSQELSDWTRQAYSPSNEVDSEVSAFYQQGDGFEALLPQFEVSDLQEPQQGVSEPREQKRCHALSQASSSSSMSKQGSGGAGVWEVPELEAKDQSNYLTAWNMEGYSPSNEYDSAMAAFYQQGDGSEVSDMQELQQGVIEPLGDGSEVFDMQELQQGVIEPLADGSEGSDMQELQQGVIEPLGDGSEHSDMQELPSGVSEPYSPSFIIQIGSGYQRSRLSATSDQYSLNQGPEPYGVYPEDWDNYQMPSSIK